MTKPSNKEKYDALSHQIEREDGLVCNRINWFLGSQGFFFAAAGVILASEKIKISSRILSIKAIAILGCFIGIVVLVGIIGAEISICYLRNRWVSTESNYCDSFPPPYGKGCAWVLGLVPRYGIPFAIIIAWIIIYFCVHKMF